MKWKNLHVGQLPLQEIIESRFVRRTEAITFFCWIFCLSGKNIYSRSPKHDNRWSLIGSMTNFRSLLWYALPYSGDQSLVVLPFSIHRTLEIEIYVQNIILPALGWNIHIAKLAYTIILDTKRLRRNTKRLRRNTFNICRRSGRCGAIASDVEVLCICKTFTLQTVTYLYDEGRSWMAHIYAS